MNVTNVYENDQQAKLACQVFDQYEADGIVEKRSVPTAADDWITAK